MAPYYEEPPPPPPPPPPAPLPVKNCTVVDEAVRAEICVPDFRTECNSDSVVSKHLEEGEFCYNVTRTSCTQKEITDDVEVCTYTYERKEQNAKAKNVEVEFVR